MVTSIHPKMLECLASKLVRIRIAPTLNLWINWPKNGRKSINSLVVLCRSNPPMSGGILANISSPMTGTSLEKAWRVYSTLKIVQFIRGLRHLLSSLNSQILSVLLVSFL